MLVISEGIVIYDGPLSGIIDRFGRYKLVRLQFSGEEAPEEMNRFGECTITGPTAELKLERHEVAGVLSVVLDRYTIIDMSVQDPPLDRLIAQVFEAGKVHSDEEQPETRAPEVSHVDG